MFAAVKAHRLLAADSDGPGFHVAAAPIDGETIMTKHRINPFAGTDLETLLRSNGIDTLVLAGVHTSSVVLSAMRHAADLDDRLIVVRDCCADRNAEVHSVLLDKVFAAYAAVVTSAQLAKTMGRQGRL